MTSKISLFNKGIYKSTLKRYFWGSVLYFIILLMSTVLPIMMMGGDVFNSESIIYSNGFILASVVIAMFVPIVVALLVFRYIHSKKASVFTHSLPVTRTSVYISTLSAAFTLMFVPVLIIGGVLVAMALSVCYGYMTVASCFVWVGMTLLTLFLMFSCACISAHLTGNTFGAIAINGLLHGIVPLVTVAVNMVAECFLYGYSNMNDEITRIVSSNFVVWLVNMSDDLSYSVDQNVYFEFGRMAVYIIIAILFFVLSWLLYKVRNLENAEDIAAFKCLNPIFKYLVTFIGALGTFALFSEFMTYSIVVFLMFVAIVSFVIYFGTEMLLKKTFKVWKSYKGFLAFAAVFALAISIFAFTSFAGFEKYVPDADDVESVALYNYYQYEEPFVEDEEFIKFVTEKHSEFLSNSSKGVLNPQLTGGYYTRIHMVYNLKNGDVVQRSYLVSESANYSLFNEFYNNEIYKNKMEQLDVINVEDIVNIGLHSNYAGFAQIEDAQFEEFMECLKKDIAELDFNQIYAGNYSSYSIDIEYKNNKYQEGSNQSMLKYKSYSLNTNFKNTLKWLKENNYENYVEISNLSLPMYVGYKLNYSWDLEEINNESVDFDGALEKGKIICISDEKQKEIVYKYIEESFFNYSPDKEYYSIICLINEYSDTLGIVGVLDEDGIAELEKILNN